MDKIDLHILILKFISTALQLVITIIILALVIVFTCSYANAADHAIVSFDSPEHLAALQDSVVGVRDTVGWEQVPVLKFGPAWDDTVGYYEYFRQPLLGFRRLVDVEIETHRTVKSICNPRTGKSMKITVIPGKAIIFYEEVN